MISFALFYTLNVKLSTSLISLHKVQIRKYISLFQKIQTDDIELIMFQGWHMTLRHLKYNVRYLNFQIQDVFELYRILEKRQMSCTFFYLNHFLNNIWCCTNCCGSFAGLLNSAASLYLLVKQWKHKVVGFLVGMNFGG